MKKPFYNILKLILVLSILVSGCQRNNNDDIEDSSFEYDQMIKEDSDDRKADEPSPSPAATTPSPENQNTEKAAPENPQINIKVLADVVNIRKDKTTQSDILKKANKNDVYRMLDEGIDSENRTWYLIEYDFGAQGWIAGWFCEKTDNKAFIENRMRAFQETIMWPINV
jgi:uncharacterized protein YgiM (DUF1202 family)